MRFETLAPRRDHEPARGTGAGFLVVSRSRRPPKNNDHKCWCRRPLCWMSPLALAYEAKKVNDKIIARSDAAYARDELKAGLQERWTELTEPCMHDDCPREAEWFYQCGPEKRFCDWHVPRGGCSCNITEDGVEDLDEYGRLLPCVDWQYFEAS